MLGKLLKRRFQVFQVLSAGGFCHTYLAKDTCQTSHPIYVVKHLEPIKNHPNSLPILRHLFTREAQALQKLGNYGWVPTLVAHFEEDQEFYLVQEFIEGHPLSAELQPGHRWSERHVVQLLQEVLGILEVVHSHGLIHRDLKPSNLIRRQQDGRLVLIDFGSVKQALTQVVTTQEKTKRSLAIGMSVTMVIGTPGYMPNEQGRGRPRSNSDIYALGMIAIQALTGLHPAQLLEDFDSGEFIWQHRANVSPKLAFVLSNMVRYHFQDRYQSATEVLQALQPIINLYSRPRISASTIQPSTQPEVPLFKSSDLRFPLNRLDAALPSLTTTQKPSDSLSEQETVSFFWENRSKLLASDLTSDSSVATPPSKSALLIGLGIGISSTLVLIFSIYYILRLPTPAAQLQKVSIFYPAAK